MLCYLMVLGSVSACTPQHTVEKPLGENEEKNLLVEEEESISDINTNLEGMSLILMKKCIKDHQEEATKEQMDQLVIAYDKELRDQYKTLFEKFISDSYFKAIEDAKDDHYVLHIENITNQHIRQEVLDAVDMGYCFSMEEGAYYLVINYKDLADNYRGLVSDELNGYHEIKKEEQLKPVRVEEYLNVTSDELYERAMTVESILKSSPDFAFREDIKGLMTRYVDGLLSIDIFSGTVDYETGQVSQSTLTVYDKIIKDNHSVLLEAVVEMKTYLEGKEFILKFDDKEGNREVLALRHRHMEDIQVSIDNRYPIN